MARAVTLGNGSILVGLDYRGQVRDFYAPFVGHNNHVSGASGSFVHRIGVFVDGELSWLEAADWQVTARAENDSLIGNLTAVNERLGISLSSTDAVHNEKNIFLRSFVVTNNREVSREIKVFFSQQFRISESRRGDTGYYDPRVKAIVHYKGEHAFLINVYKKEQQFSDYNIGLFGIEGKEGTYHDAGDGVLERNPIEHGSVDSVIGITSEIKAQGTAEIMYWVCYGKNIAETHELNSHVLNETAAALISTTRKYWRAWVRKEDTDLSLLSPELHDLYVKSLLTIRVHTDNTGAIIASSDTDMLHHGRDTYSYVWPRDGAFIAHTLDRAGYENVAKLFFQFITKCIESGGYLMHKYRSDGVLGSSWHPWMQNGRPHLPIQEDETALVIFMLWQHYERTKDLEFIESVYNDFIEPAANFMCEFIEARYGLPMSSYDLWEEKYGISTYTSSCVYGALTAAVHFANTLGKTEPARTYASVAQRMRSSIMEHLYDEKLRMFVKHIVPQDNDDPIVDRTIDISSFFGPVYFGVIDADDPRMKRARQVIEDTLRVHTHETGYVRYEHDNYYKLHEERTPNPWVITTLWMARYTIMTAKTLKGLEEAKSILEWTVKNASSSGMLAEQMRPSSGEHLSAAPLIWSHAELVATILDYIEKHNELTHKDADGND